MIGKHKCQLCSHVFNPDEKPLKLKCHAFPNGIPEEKLMYITRDSCIDCNNGIGFEPHKDTFEDIIPDPDYIDFDGIYVGSTETSSLVLENRHNLSGLSRYMKDNNKTFKELTEEELKTFELP